MIGDLLFPNYHYGAPPPRIPNSKLGNKGDYNELPSEYVILDGDNWTDVSKGWIDYCMQHDQLELSGWHIGERGQLVYRYVPINVPPDAI